MAPTHTTTFRLPVEVVADLDSKQQPDSSRTAVLLRELERYRVLLARGRREMRVLHMFSPDEQALLADVFNGLVAWNISEMWLSNPLIACTVEDAVTGDGIDAKWGVDGPALVGKLHALQAHQTVAIIDAVERFWAAVGRGSQRDPRRLLNEKDEG